MIHAVVITQFAKMLTNLDAFFDKAIAQGQAKKFDPEILLQARLAPDQFALLRQVQIACDTAKLGAALLSGKKAPSHDDSEKTIADLRRRIAETIAFLADFTEDDFDGVETRVISRPRWEAKTLTGAQFAQHHVIPNFFFHVTTSYAILRHNGVDVGKSDYLGPMPFKV